MGKQKNNKYNLLQKTQKLIEILYQIASLIKKQLGNDKKTAFINCVNSVIN